MSVWSTKEVAHLYYPLKQVWKANTDEGWGEGRGDFSLVWPRTGSRGGPGVSKQDAAAAAQEGPSSKLSGVGSLPLMERGGVVCRSSNQDLCWTDTLQQASLVQVWHTSYKEVLISWELPMLFWLTSFKSPTVRVSSVSLLQNTKDQRKIKNTCKVWNYCYLDEQASLSKHFYSNCYSFLFNNMKQSLWQPT